MFINIKILKRNILQFIYLLVCPLLVIVPENAKSYRSNLRAPRSILMASSVTMLIGDCFFPVVHIPGQLFGPVGLFTKISNTHNNFGYDNIMQQSVTIIQYYYRYI